ncbi:MAG: NADH-quinone oxidoreductase subunit NuoH [Vampirovibrio sp.]|nr:NADH-quinone oxidoreductase subunit NuoH [Vampirovibrio sp.]
MAVSQVQSYPDWLAQLFGFIGVSLPDDFLLFQWAVILFTAIAIVGQAAVVFMVLMERKVLAWLTQRIGPNRVGPFGLLQTLADGVKLLFKEDIMTRDQDKLLFTLGPALFFLPCFVVYALIPFTSELLAIALPTGALLFFALSSISVIGIVISGWASNNKYSLLGGMRSAAQAISYEIPLVLAVLAVVLYAGTMNIRDIIEMQNNGAFGFPFGFISWFSIWLFPLSFIIFFISSIAEVNRIPFDLPEAESELVSGYNTEYTGMKFATFFLAEYAALFAMGALTVCFFFGGYYSPLGGLLSETLKIDVILQSLIGIDGFAGLVRQLEMISWMMLKTYIFIFVAMWIRGSLPRLKPDELMGFSWKFLIPLSLINIFMIAIQKYWHVTSDLTFGLAWAAVLVLGVGGFCVMMSRHFTAKLEERFKPALT